MNSNSWLSSIPIAGGNGVSVETLNNKIYFAGGRKFINFTNTLVTDNIYVYDIISTTWSLQHLSEPKFNMAHTIVANKIMWGGGLRFNNSAVCDVQFFDPVNNSSTSSNLYSGQEYWDRYNPTAYIKNNKVVIPRFGSYPHYNRFDIYDLNTGGWSFGQVNDDLYGPSIISINNVIYIAGGYYNGTLSRQVWKLEF
jgi:N-acetylneuraminic acid mutarotase